MEKSAFEKLVWLMNRLRDPGGCPWDREQTSESLKPYVLEEAYEVVEAIDDPNPVNLKEELGDLLYQVLFLSKIASEKKQFDINDVLTYSYEKLYNRHPHVFGEERLNTSAEVLKQWEKNKAIEKGATRKSILDGLPATLPALLKAQRIQERASRVGFDWHEVEPAFEKVKEELAEFTKAIESKDRDKMEDELGDVLFALVNVSRFLNVSPEIALQRTLEKFSSRFSSMEIQAKQSGRKLEDMKLDELDQLWNNAKQQERQVSV